MNSALPNLAWTPTGSGTYHVALPVGVYGIRRESSTWIITRDGGEISRRFRLREAKETAAWDAVERANGRTGYANGRTGR